MKCLHKYLPNYKFGVFIISKGMYQILDSSMQAQQYVVFMYLCTFRLELVFVCVLVTSNNNKMPGFSSYALSIIQRAEIKVRYAIPVHMQTILKKKTVFVLFKHWSLFLSSINLNLKYLTGPFYKLQATIMNLNLADHFAFKESKHQRISCFNNIR